MTESEPRPDGHRTNILMIPLPDARPRPVAVPARDAVSGSVRAPASDPGPDVRVVRPAPVVQPPAPIPDAPTPSSDWAPGLDDDEDASGDWYVVRPLAAPRPQQRTRAASPTGRGHLMAFAIAIPCIGAAGILASVIDTLSNALAAVLPVAVLLGVVVAWLFLTRLGAWLRACVAAAVGMLRR